MVGASGECNSTLSALDIEKGALSPGPSRERFMEEEYLKDYSIFEGIHHEWG